MQQTQLSILFLIGGEVLILCRLKRCIIKTLEYIYYVVQIKTNYGIDLSRIMKFFHICFYS